MRRYKDGDKEGEREGNQHSKIQFDKEPKKFPSIPERARELSCRIDKSEMRAASCGTGIGPCQHRARVTGKRGGTWGLRGKANFRQVSNFNSCCTLEGLVG